MSPRERRGKRICILKWQRFLQNDVSHDEIVRVLRKRALLTHWGIDSCELFVESHNQISFFIN